MAELEAEVDLMVTNARDFSIMTAADMVQAGELWNAIKDIRAKVAETFGPIKEKTHAAWKEAVAQEKRHDEPLAEAQRGIKGKMIAYDRQQEAIRRVEQAKAEAEAKRKSEEEALELAAELEKAGLKQEAAFAVEFPEEPPQVIIPKATPKIEGFVIRTHWTFDVIDHNSVPREFLCVDLVKIGQVVRAMKGATNIPGIRAFEEKI